MLTREDLLDWIDHKEHIVAMVVVETKWIDHMMPKDMKGLFDIS